LALLEDRRRHRAHRHWQKVHVVHVHATHAREEDAVHQRGGIDGYVHHDLVRPLLRTPALVLAMLWFRLKDLM
jgi:hypothetical protein